MAPEHPSIRTLSGYTYVEILKIAEQVYWGECGGSQLAPPLMTGVVHKVVMPGTGPVYDQSWPTEQTRAG